MSGPIPMPEAIRASLTKRLGPVYFSDLKAHLDRDGVFIVRADLDLVDCGVAVATDDVTLVTKWIEATQLRKPSRSEREAWEAEEGRRWIAIVVQPFVLVQDAPDGWEPRAPQA
ncbi:MAG: DUF2288 family protein [Myxococcales bacterium]|nr:DUF2288 family protein [Myxococcales bacterium]